MRQATINKWINIFEHHNPEMTVADYCEQIGVSRSAYYEKKRYFRKHPELAKFIKHSCEECETAAETDGSDQVSHNETSENESGDAPAIVPLMVVPEELHNDISNGSDETMKSGIRNTFGSIIEISVGTARLRCSTAIPETDLAKLVRVCASV